MNPLPGLIQLFTSFWLWSVVGLLSLAFSWLVNDALGKKLNRRQLSRLLRRRRYAVLYHELLQAALARVDRWLTPSVGPSDAAREAEGRRAWSWPLFDLSLRLGLAYPLLTLIAVWGVFGTDGKLGSLVVLPEALWGVRMLALLGLVTLVWLFILPPTLPDKQTIIDYVHAALVSSTFFFTSVLAVLLFFVLAGGISFRHGLALVFQGAFGGAVGIAVAIAIAFGGVFAGAGAASFAVAVAVLLDLAAGIASAIADAFGDRISVTFKLAVFAFVFYSVVCIVLAGGAAAARAVGAAAERTGFGLIAYAGLVALLLASLAIATRFSPPWIERAPTLLLFLGLLPLLNAVFDFLSIGLTRFLLRRGAVSAGFGALGWAFWDVASALGFFALLGLALLTMVQWLNVLGAARLLDLAALFVDLRADPGAYWWLYVTIFSTLLPTLLHLVLASFSALLAIMPEGVALFIRRQLPRIEADAMAKAAAFWTLSTIGFLAIAAVAFGLYGLVSGALAVFPHLGDWYLYGFELYAAWLGAPVVPVRPAWL